jgi:hypothetical protein
MFARHIKDQVGRLAYPMNWVCACALVLDEAPTVNTGKEEALDRFW